MCHRLKRFVQNHPEKKGIGILSTQFQELFHQQFKRWKRTRINHWGGDECPLWLNQLSFYMDLEVFGKKEFGLMEWDKVINSLNKYGRYDLDMLYEFRYELLSKEGQILLGELERVKVRPDQKCGTLIDDILKHPDVVEKIQKDRKALKEADEQRIEEERKQVERDRAEGNNAAPRDDDYNILFDNEKSDDEESKSNNGGNQEKDGNKNNGGNQERNGMDPSGGGNDENNESKQNNEGNQERDGMGHCADRERSRSEEEGRESERDRNIGESKPASKSTNQHGGFKKRATKKKKKKKQKPGPPPLYGTKL